ncbi:MAG: hypothetical protein N2109_05935 [Fimbriimonadales bacterium]|nr:hypothetical protein [Fimbriimonadales bacterium]
MRAIPKAKRPKLAVWKFASCDGCQLSILDLEDQLLEVLGSVELAYFPEATRAVLKGPYDISLVEGSITTRHDAKRIQEIRRNSAFLVSIGACATAGGIQALRNYANLRNYIQAVYPRPEFIDSLDKSTPIRNHVFVDFELRGCPVSKEQLLEVLNALLNGRKPNIPAYSVCLECKRKGNVCVMVAASRPCLGPVTQAGCGAICPSFHRGCYGCFGPAESPNGASLAAWLRRLGQDDEAIVRLFRSFNAASEAFHSVSTAHENPKPQG